MSLFKAYDKVEISEDHDNEPTYSSQQWLENSSFESRTTSINELRVSSQTKQNLYLPIEINDGKEAPSNLFVIDIAGDERLHSVDTLRGHAAPRFKNISKSNIGAPRSKKKSKRYTKAKNIESKSIDFTLHEEDKILRNKLKNNENNIEVWKEFINNQARYIVAGNLKAITERQISIIDEALIKNPDNADLYELWFSYNKKIFSYDDFAKIVIDRTQKDSGNYLLWLGLIDYTQKSVSECNVMVVLELYRKATSSFKKFRNQHISNKGVLFKLFQRVTLFLRQTGSWRELLYLLQYTLWLNCNDMDVNEIFKFPKISQSNLIELEETVLQSGLPLSEIWYRIESLRETFSWSTVENSFKNMTCALAMEEMDDLTTVFNKDTTKFNLLIYMLIVLRIPILPNRQSINELLSINEITWHFDSADNMLPIFYDSDLDNSRLQQITYNMLVAIIDGPQYWGPRPFTLDYYEFALSLIKNIMDNLKDDEDAKLAFGLLYIRFIKLHCAILKTSEKEINTKSIKRKIKVILSENDDLKSSLLLYIEYAKVEVLILGMETGINTLRVLLQSIDSKQSEYAYLLRTYISLQSIKCGKEIDKKYCISLLAKLVQAEVVSDMKNSEIQTLINKFYTNPHNEDFSSVTPFILIPSPQENWFCCAAYFIYFTVGLEKAIEYMKFNNKDMAPVIKEGLYEWCTHLIHDSSNTRQIQEYLKLGITEFPNNTRLLQAYTAVCLQWIKIKPALTTGLFGIVTLTSFARLQADKATDSSEKAAYKNRELAVLNDATQDPILQQNPLIWKLYLQSLYEFGSDKIMDVMTQALEMFPWLKALYVSGVRYAPQEHSSFQDIIAEKELSLLALPEELEILREDNPD